MQFLGEFASFVDTDGADWLDVEGEKRKFSNLQKCDHIVETGQKKSRYSHIQTDCIW